MVLLAATAPMATAVPAVPTDLPARTTELRTALEDLSEATSADEARELWGTVPQSGDPTASALWDLSPTDGDLLAAYLDGLDEAIAEGNLTDVRSLARAAESLVEEALEPLAATWATNATGVAPGEPEMRPDGTLRVPVILHNPPPAGVGAFDVALHADPETASAVGGTVSLGTGQATADTANGSVRLASFDAKAAGGFGQGHRAFLHLGYAVFEPTDDRGNLTLDVRIHELVDPQGERLLAVGADGDLVVPAQVDASAFRLPAWAVWGLVAAGVVGVWALGRRFLRV